MNTPKVSICTPVFNRPVYIAETIESALNQTFTDFELIITDNCSTDNTLEVIKGYAAKDKRIKYFSNECHIPANLNRAILLSCGQYIKPLFSDDKLAPNCLELFVNILDNHPKVSLVTSYTQAFGLHNHVRDNSYFPGIGELDGKLYQKDLLINSNWTGSPSSIMFRCKDLHVGMYQPAWHWVGDLDMSMKLLGVGNAFIVPEILSFLRIHHGSESHLHGGNFKLISERFMFTNIASWFPQVYGTFTKPELKKLHKHLLKRLAREGLENHGLTNKLKMMEIGLSRLPYSRLMFLLTLAKNMPRLFHNKKSNNPKTDADSL
jgi:glycosyltransferase involved in cell wall biosynthesis